MDNLFQNNDRAIKNTENVIHQINKRSNKRKSDLIRTNKKK